MATAIVLIEKAAQMHNRLYVGNPGSEVGSTWVSMATDGAALTAVRGLNGMLCQGAVLRMEGARTEPEEFS